MKCSRLLSLLLLISLLAWTTNSALVPEDDWNGIPFYEGDPKFLFVGNSYTGQNSLPGTFGNIVKDVLPEWSDINPQSVNPGGHTLGQHYAEMEARSDNAARRLATALVDNPNNWKWVTLQDQSQVPAFNQWDWDGTEYHRSKEAAVAFNDLIEAAGGQTMFYMTWGRRSGDRGNSDLFPDFLTMQDMLVEGYMGYVEATTTDDRPTYVAPVGLVYQTIYNDLVDQGIEPTDDDTLFHSLYTNDGSHPTPRGTYVAAMTIFTAMFGLDPTTITWAPDGIDEATANALRDAVARTILETSESGFIEYPWAQAWTNDSGGSSGGTPEPTAAPTVSTPQPTVSTPQPTVATPQPTAATPQPTVSTPQPTAATPQPSSAANTPSPTSSSATPAPTSTIITTGQQVLTDTTTKGSITIEIQYDDFPQDIAWTFLQQGSSEALYFQPYNTLTTPGANQSMTFTNLTQNATYLFKISDQQGDGLCCKHGMGYVEIVDNNNFGKSTILFTLQATLGAFYEVDMTVGNFGQATVTDKANEYVPTTWPDLESILWAVNTTQEPQWPGEFPTNETFALVVNMDLDDDPQDVAWELLYHGTQDETEQDPSNDWTLIGSWNGSMAMAGSLDARELLGLKEGWYRFVVTDSAMNGLCCNPNATDNGYITLTGPLAATQDLGLIWGSDGDFGALATIRFRMDDSGYVSHIQFEDNKDARSVAPSNAPTASPAPTTSVLQIDRNEATKGPTPGNATMPNATLVPTSHGTEPPYVLSDGEDGDDGFDIDDENYPSSSRSNSFAAFFLVAALCSCLL